MTTWQMGFYFVGLFTVSYGVGVVLGYLVRRIHTFISNRTKPERSVTDL